MTENIPMFTIDGEPEIVENARRHVLNCFADLEFYEDEHVYLLNGKSLPSASTIAHRFESRPFDMQQQAVLQAQKYGHTPEYWLRKWECVSFRATTLGTKSHEYGESLAYIMAGHPEFIRPSVKAQYLEKYDYLAPIHPTEEAARKFLEKLPKSYHLVLNEARAYSGKNPDASKNLKEQMCGTFDMLYYYDGGGNPDNAGFVIFDYKTNASLTNEYSRRFNTMLLPPFTDFYQESICEYAIQLSLYSLMLEDIGMKIIDRQLVWLKGDGNYEMFRVPDVSDRLRKVL